MTTNSRSKGELPSKTRCRLIRDPPVPATQSLLSITVQSFYDALLSTMKNGSRDRL
jgi:hypothetical protein